MQKDKDLELDITDLTCLDLPVKVSYKSLVDPDGNKFPYYYVSMKTDSKWTLISTKLSNRYKPILIDDIFKKFPYKIDKNNSSVSEDLLSISCIIVLESEKFTQHPILQPAYFITNSYNGSTTMNIYVGCKNKDTGYFMPYLSSKISIKHNNKTSFSDLYKVDINSLIKKCSDFIDVSKESSSSTYKKDLLHITSSIQGLSLYDIYVEQVQKCLDKKLTQSVLLNKVRAIEDLYLHLTAKK